MVKGYNLFYAAFCFFVYGDCLDIFRSNIVLCFSVVVQELVEAVHRDGSGRRARQYGIDFIRSGDVRHVLGGLEGTHGGMGGSGVIHLIVIDDIALTYLTRMQTRQIVFGLNFLGQLLLGYCFWIRFSGIVQLNG